MLLFCLSSIIIFKLTIVLANEQKSAEVFNERREIQCDGLNEMPKIMRNLIILQEDCGEVCDTSDDFKKITGNPFDTMKKEFECDILLTSPTLNPPLVFDEQIIDKRPPRISQLPKTISNLFSYNNRVPLYSRYYERDSSLITKPENPHWNIKDIGGLVKELTETGQIYGAYGVKTSRDMVQILKKYMIDSIKDKHVLVIGSTLPWVEAILLYLGVDRITTLEYASQNNEHPKINLITPEELRKSILEGDVPQFDAMVTFSSLEHSGLGRYGDPLNPWGDLITMAQAWCLLKPGARALVGVPGGKDGIAFNSNRVYGKTMLPHLFSNFEAVFSEYRDFPKDGFASKNIGDFCENPKEDLMHCFQPMTVLEKRN